MTQDKNTPTFAKKDRKLITMTEWELIFCLGISMLGGVVFGIMLPV